MKCDSINMKEVLSAYQNRIKPNGFLIEGKRLFAKLEAKGLLHSTINDYSKEVYRPGIFKRIFVSSLKHGLYYITAKAMMTENPILFSKILSTKLTANLGPMILKHNTILVSCAGSIGNIRLISKSMDGNIGSQDIIRVVPKDKYGFIYAYLSSQAVYNYLQSKLYGSVVPRIEPETVSNIPIPDFPADFQQEVDNMIQESARLREQATDELRQAQQILKEKASLPDLTPEDYDFYGSTIQNRTVSTFSLNKKDISLMTINAFNYSQRVRNLESKITCNCCSIGDVILGGTFFSTGSFPRVEVKKKHGIMLINQSDIFDAIIEGKYISRRGVKTDSLVEYGEVMIAGVGTLGENETFCRTIFANEDLVGQLVSGEFIRMKTNGKVPAGYLYAWLSSDYGFRLIRSTQAGTKLCRPIQKLLLQKPIPIIDNDSMNEIDKIVKTAHTKRHQANKLELAAIANVEQEIEKWNK